MTVIVKDLGASRLVATLGRPGKQAVKVGVLAKDGGKIHADGDLTTAAIAAIHEFGLGNVPERSWLRGYIDQNRIEIDRMMRLTAAKVARGMPKALALKQLGVWLQAQIQKRIADGIDPPNAPSTIAQKGSSKPLIDTGQLRSSISHEVD